MGLVIGEPGITDFETRFANAFPPFEQGDSFVVGVSGGADSTALLVAAARLGARVGFAVRCVHVDHGIRPSEERAGDRSAVESLCRELAVPFIAIDPPTVPLSERARETGRGLEAAARDFRRQALIAEAARQGVRHILVGHTRNDALETTLMRVLRGSGPIGLASIREKRGLFERPLLSFDRSEIVDFLRELGIPYRIDSTNSDTSYLRNRVRLTLIPLLDAEFPSWRAGIGSVARIQRDVADLLVSETKRRLRWRWVSSDRRAVRCDAVAFFHLPRILREEAVFRAGDRLEALRASDSRGEAIPDFVSEKARDPARSSIALFCSGTAASVDLGGFRVLIRDGSVIVESSCGARIERGFSLVVSEPSAFRFRGRSFRVDDASPDGVPESVPLSLPFAIRSCRASDAIVGLGGRLRGLGHLLSDLRSSAPNAKPVATVEDASGIAAIILTDGRTDTVCMSINRKECETYYARPVFFSIL